MIQIHTSTHSSNRTFENRTFELEGFDSFSCPEYDIPNIPIRFVGNGKEVSVMRSFIELKIIFFEEQIFIELFFIAG